MKKLLFLGIAILCSFVSCKEFADVLHQDEGDSAEIVFKANIGKYAVKATNTSFEENDAVAILAANPINSGFVKYVVQNGTLSSETPIYWKKKGYDPTKGAAFCLVYPYDPQLTTWDLNSKPNYEVGVNTDQSTHSQYTASDFMVGEGSGLPEDGEVTIYVEHQFSQVYICIDNKSGKDIKDVYLSDVYTKGIWNLNADFAVSGEKESIKAFPVQGSSTQDYILILPPQTSQPQLIITTTGGEQITYTLPSEVEFKSGYKSNASLVLDEESQVTGFHLNINNWLSSAGEITFENEGTTDEWEYWGTGKYMDDILSGLMHKPHHEMDVEYYRHKTNPDRIMIKDPYKNWPYSNSFIEGSQIILNITEDGKRYIENGSSTGISAEGLGIVFFESYCMENGWVDSKEKGTYLTDNYGEGCWSAYKDVSSGTVKYSILATPANSTTWVVNNNGICIFTFPGSVRMPAIVNCTIPAYDSNSCTVNVIAGHDLTRFGLTAIPYYEPLTNSLLSSIIKGETNYQIIYDNNKPSGERAYSEYFVFPETGVYRLVGYGDGTYNGEFYDWYTYSGFIPYVAPFDEAPACMPQIVSCSSNANDPLSIDLVLKVEYIYSASILAVPQSDFDALGLSEADYYNYIVDNGSLVGGGTYADYAFNGRSYTLNGLKPNTEYIVLFAAENMFGNTGYITETFYINDRF